MMWCWIPTKKNLILIEGGVIGVCQMCCGHSPILLDIMKDTFASPCIYHLHLVVNVACLGVERFSIVHES